jgi:serine/threonine protein kinase
LQGHTLADELKQNGQLSPKKTFHIITQVCHGIFAAHQIGLIHRDLKPENIFLTPDYNDKFVVKILDFGLAKLIRHSEENETQEQSEEHFSADETLDPSHTIDADETGTWPASPNLTPQVRLTNSGQIFGTPMYMSPEQSKGIAVDHRSDIYALGLILYECLTGQVPFKGNSAVEIMIAHVSQQPPPLSHKLKTPPRNIESLIKQCLAKSTNERPDQVSVLLKQFDQHQAELDSDIPFELHGDSSSRCETLEQFIDQYDIQDQDSAPSITARKSNKRSYAKLTLVICLVIVLVSSLALFLSSSLPRCSDQPPPEYNFYGKVCLTQNTVALWNFDIGVFGQTDTNPDQNLMLEEDSLASFKETKSRLLDQKKTEIGETLAGFLWNKSDKTVVFNIYNGNIDDNSFVLEMWIKPEQEQRNCMPFVIGKFIGNFGRDCVKPQGDLAGWGLTLSSNKGSPSYRIVYNQIIKGRLHRRKNKHFTFKTIVYAEQWSHIVLIKKDKRLTAIINGIEQAVINNLPPIIQHKSNTIHFGNFVASTVHSYQGQMDEIRFSKTATPIEEVIKMYKKRLKAHKDTQ